MGISPDVMIMTRAEFSAAEDRAFQRGVTRGRFEEGMDRSKEITPSEGPSKSTDPASPDAGGGPPFQLEGWTFEDHGGGIVYVRAPSGKHVALGYLIGSEFTDRDHILRDLVIEVLRANAPAEA